MIRIGLVAAILAAALGEAKAGAFQCERGEAFDPDVRAEVQRIAHNRPMEAIVTQYRARWDAAYIRAQCEAFAAGRSHDLGCIKDARDWDAIRRSIPAEYFEMDHRALHPASQAERAKPTGLREAKQFCFDVGAIRQ